MAERPILFSSPMVRALLDGSKTQTRRIVKENPPYVENFCSDKGITWDGHVRSICPYGQPGDRLYVRETWQYYGWTEDGEPCIRFAADNATTWPQAPGDEKLVDQWERLSRHENFSIDNHARDRRWRPSIHMPRWASRILLEITSVRVGRLQAITEADARAEGVTIEDRHMSGYCAGEYLPPAIRAFRDLWESINGADSWDANPWCWAISFKRVTP